MSGDIESALRAELFDAEEAFNGALARYQAQDNPSHATLCLHVENARKRQKAARLALDRHLLGPELPDAGNGTPLPRGITSLLDTVQP